MQILSKGIRESRDKDHRWRYAGDLGDEEEAAHFMECLEKLDIWLSSNVWEREL